MAKKKKYSPAYIELLTDFKGIGKKTAVKLLDHFEKPKAVIASGLEGLQKAVGEKTGVAIYRRIHGANAPVQRKDEVTPGRATKYTSEVGEAIAEDYAEGTGTIVEIMHKHGLSEQTFYNWQETNLEFFELIKNARQRRKGRSYEMALNGKKILLEGHEVIEQTTNTQPYTDADGRKQNRVTSVTINKRFLPPNSTMVIFELVNSSGGEYQHTHNVKHDTTPRIPPYDFSQFSHEELVLFEKLAEKATRNGQDE